jgi:hypothetical protein
VRQRPTWLREGGTPTTGTMEHAVAVTRLGAGVTNCPGAFRGATRTVATTTAAPKTRVAVGSQASSSACLAAVADGALGVAVGQDVPLGPVLLPAAHVEERGEREEMPPTQAQESGCRAG